MIRGQLKPIHGLSCLSHRCSVVTKKRTIIRFLRNLSLEDFVFWEGHGRTLIRTIGHVIQRSLQHLNLTMSQVKSASLFTTLWWTSTAEAGHDYNLGTGTAGDEALSCMVAMRLKP